MNWIDINNEIPNVEGKYIVKTTTTMGNTHRLDATCTLKEDKGKVKAHFNVSNQIVTHWLKEN
jgi:hypothetical protein